MFENKNTGGNHWDKEVRRCDFLPAGKMCDYSVAKLLLSKKIPERQNHLKTLEKKRFLEVEDSTMFWFDESLFTKKDGLYQVAGSACF